MMLPSTVLLLLLLRLPIPRTLYSRRGFGVSLHRSDDFDAKSRFDITNALPYVTLVGFGYRRRDQRDSLMQPGEREIPIVRSLVLQNARSSVSNRYSPLNGVTRYRSPPPPPFHVRFLLATPLSPRAPPLSRKRGGGARRKGEGGEGGNETKRENRKKNCSYFRRSVPGSGQSSDMVGVTHKKHTRERESSIVALQSKSNI